MLMTTQLEMIVRMITYLQVIVTNNHVHHVNCLVTLINIFQVIKQSQSMKSFVPLSSAFVLSLAPKTNPRDGKMK